MGIVGNCPPNWGICCWVQPLVGSQFLGLPKPLRHFSCSLSMHSHLISVNGNISLTWNLRPLIFWPAPSPQPDTCGLRDDFTMIPWFRHACFYPSVTTATVRTRLLPCQRPQRGTTAWWWNNCVQLVWLDRWCADRWSIMIPSGCSVVDAFDWFNWVIISHKILQKDDLRT